MFKSGFVTLIGRPNSGKSTLVNTIVGKKVAITSDVAQTTRHQLRAIYNTSSMQAIFVDTPGLHKPHDVLGQELNASAIQGLTDVDIVCMLIDASKPIGKGDIWVADHLKTLKCKKICVITKTDLVSEEDKMMQVKEADQLGHWDSVVCLSSVTKNNVDAFLEEIEFFLDEGPAWFAKDVTTDQPQDVIIAEYIREKIIKCVFDEVPHSVGVEVDDVQYDKNGNLAKIFATIFVERDSQKGILIGMRGQTIKLIGIMARKDLEKLLGCKVFLDLSVKVRKNWRRDLNQIKRFGYGEGL